MTETGNDLIVAVRLSDIAFTSWAEERGTGGWSLDRAARTLTSRGTLINTNEVTHEQPGHFPDGARPERGNVGTRDVCADGAQAGTCPAP